MFMIVYAATLKGKTKIENEDRVIVGSSILASGVFYTESSCDVIAIADGVGGNNAGAVASHYVANEICRMKNISLEILSVINDDLLRLSRETNDYRAMATTLSGIFITENENFLFSVGNTRVYILQNGKYLKQLTTDDTTVQYLLSTGQISTDDMSAFDRKNEITACFGGNNPALFNIHLSHMDKNFVPFLITSDGIHDYVSVDCMEDIISDCGISAETCQKIIQTADNNGSKDDKSIILGEL